MNIVNIAGDLYEELGRPSGVAIPYISSWLMNNIGILNATIGTDYYLSGSFVSGVPCYSLTSTGTYPTLVSGELGDQEGAIYKLIFMSRWYTRQIGQFSNAMAYDNITQITDEGSTIKFVSKTDIIKALGAQKQIINQEIMDLAFNYRMYKATPGSINNDAYPTLIDLII